MWFWNSNSKKTYTLVKNTDYIMVELQTMINQLIDNYKSFYLDKNFCDQLTIIENDKLLKFRKMDVNGTQYTLGMRLDDDVIKQNKCDEIINHYQQQIDLLQKIQNNINFVCDRIHALTIGPRCNGQPEVFNLDDCLRRNGNWTETVILPDDRVRENINWYQQLHDMQNDGISYLKLLKSICTQLYKYDQYITDQKLHYLDIEADKIIKKYQEIIFERYRNLLATPTYTMAQINEQKLREEQNRADYSSKVAAIRMSKGLSPLGR